MEILEGLLTINGKDPYREYKAVLAEDKESSHSNYDELLTAPAAKDYTSVSVREENGERLPETLPQPHYKARDVTLQFGILADTPQDWYRCYTGFLSFLKSGWLFFSLPEMGTSYKMYYKECISQQMATYLSDGKVFGKMKIKFREPNPYATIDESSNTD